MLLMRAREAVMQRFRPHLRRHQLTEQQWRILRALAERDGMEMQDLSDCCCIQPPSLSRTIPALDDRGLVKRFAHPVDQRRVIVRLSDPGRLLFKAMSVESERIYEELSAEVGIRRISSLYRAVEDFVAVAETGRSDLNPP